MKKNILLILFGIFISHSFLFGLNLSENYNPPMFPPSGDLPLSKETTESVLENPLILQQEYARVEEYVEIFQEENAKFIDALISERWQLPYDHLTIGESPAQYCNPTEIGLWLVYLTDVAKGDIRVSNLTPGEALQKLNQALDSVTRAPKWKGLLGWYDISGSRIRKTGEASAFDNANFAASLGVIIGAFIDEQDSIKGEIVRKAQRLLNGQKRGWKALYDRRNELIYGDERRQYRIDRLYTEGRLAPLIAITLADINENVWRNLEVVRGSYQLSNGENVDLVLPWQGAFQAYLPLIFVPEDEWSEDMRVVHQNYAAVQVDYANETNIPALRSACSDPYHSTYVYLPELGVPGASEVPVRGDVGTPHATALLNLIASDRAIRLMQELEKFTQGGIYGPYGMRDSVGEHGEVSNTYVSLDHLMMTVAMAGKVNQGYFSRYLESVGKLEQIKELYEELDIPLTLVEIPEVKEFEIPSPPEEPEQPPATGVLIDFDEGRSGPHVLSFGVWDGPSGRIRERIVDGVLEVTYNTPEYNGLWFKLTDLEPIGNYKYLVFDIKAEKGFEELKLEWKKGGGWLGIAYTEDIPADEWITVRVPISDFNISKSDLEKIPDEFVITIEGWKLPSSQRRGVFYLDNIRLEK